MTEYTPAYNILCPTEDDTMSQQVGTGYLTQNLQDAFQVLEKAANPDSVTTLPQSGSYKVGDRVYLSDSNYRSSFILLSRDTSWGWIWRPIQAAISPWQTVPAAAFSGSNGADYQQLSSNPLQFALDNKGNCYWRGAIQKKVTPLPDNTSQAILANIPDGLRHHTSGTYTLAIDHAGPQSTTGVDAFRAGRWFIRNDGYNTFRFWTAAATDNQNIHFTGIEYACSKKWYLNP